MGDPEVHLRTVVEEDVVSAVLDEARKRFPYIDDAYSNLQWTIAHDPEDADCVSIPNAGVFFIYKTAPSPLVTGGPVFLALYRLEGPNKVVIHRLRVLAED